MSYLHTLFIKEKHAVFYINLLLLLMVIGFLLFDISIELFFYLTLFITIITSYFFFKRSKKLAKSLILTNLFMFTYFVFPKISVFLFQLFSSSSYLIVLFYHLVVAYLFLHLSGFHEEVFKRLRCKQTLLLSTIIVGIFFGLFFVLVQEPVPTLFLEIFPNPVATLGFIVMNAALIALSEQLIFVGFLFNTYKSLTNTKNAYMQTSLMFVMFHILRFEQLVLHYVEAFPLTFLLYIIGYYALLFLFMLASVYLYNVNGKNHKGSFTYSLILHFTTDLFLFIFYLSGI